MGYSMQLESDTVYVENDFFSPQLLESTTIFKNDIVSTELNDISLNHFHLIYGKQSAVKDSPLLLHFENSFYLTHFVLNKESRNKKQEISAKNQNTYSTYHQDRDKPELGFIGESQEYEFFEMAFEKSFLNRIIEDDNAYSQTLYDQYNESEYADAARYTILPSMLQCVHDLKNTVFTGALRQLYLETKAAELFLLQVQALKNTPEGVSALKHRDIECLHEARLYIEQNYHTPCRIIDLAKIVGINQTKLKNGFKELFGTTIFGYIRDLQMEKAKQLILDEKLYVNEVADQVGYKHPQHFAAAFKRRFGILPSELKR